MFDKTYHFMKTKCIDEQNIGFMGSDKDKLRITFKDAGGLFQDDDLCDHGYTYSFIYRNDDKLDSKYCLCATIEIVIWILKILIQNGIMCKLIFYTRASNYAGLHIRKKMFMVWLGQMDELFRRKLFCRR